MKIHIKKQGFTPCIYVDELAEVLALAEEIDTHTTTDDSSCFF